MNSTEQKDTIRINGQDFYYNAEKEQIESQDHKIIYPARKCPHCSKIHYFRPIDTYTVCCGLRIEQR